MVDAGNNSMAKRIKDVRELRTTEKLLLQGTTIAAIAEAVGASTKQARRLVGALKELGCVITDDFVPGTRDAATYKMAKASRFFAAHKPVR